MSQSIPPQPGIQRHRNQRLFSDYYLDNILPRLWDDLSNEAAVVMKQLQQLYIHFTPNPNSEAQTEEDWIKPVLRFLGHTFEVQTSLKVPDGVQRPDYFFYRDEAARIANKDKRVVTEVDLKQGAFAVGDAKQWERSLDRAIGGSDAFSNKNPSYQIFFYMLHSGLPWGILTNGRYWRIYHKDTAHKLEIYYEVDLPFLLTPDGVSDEIALRNFLYFYTFFRRQAFDSGPLSLEQILLASTEYAQGVSEGLRQQVYDALRYVAQGFFDHPDNKLTPTPETCRLIYDNSLTLLYRLLFIFYAEARDLLPVRSNKPYRNRYSLYNLKRDIVIGLQEEILPDTAMVWARLKEVFKFINAGRSQLNITTFDGGLFNPQRHPFLERYVVGDLNLCRAIDKLARVNLQFVDYRDLAERHLGTIYEGLLEYTLRVATETMVELKSSSKIVPAQGVPKKDIVATFRPGEVYLVTDSGERKITGSYYTPDYIVKYMVEQTLRPILDAAVQKAHTDAERIDAVLAINVLDPAMGSGHFPVEVTGYIARYLVELGIKPEETDEADLTYWKRRVVQNCIYGVDLNPLAVELAKLSLWLSTVAKDRPLNFLDHHLHSGNALIGSWLEDVAAGQHPKAKQAQKRARQVVEAAQQAGQLSLLDDAEFRQSTSSALATIASIEQSPGETIIDVKAQEAAYEKLRQQFIEKYLYLANLGVAVYYNVEVGQNDWRAAADYALGKAVDHSLPTAHFETWLDDAATIADTKHFFHWELEFPEIFFDSTGQPRGENAGFDVVIGNPPYVRQEQIGPDKPYFQERYEVYHGVADLFVYFFAQGLRLLRKDGKLAYISSNSWLSANYATSLRQYLRTQTTIETIIDLGDNHVFADAPDLNPAIQIIRKVLPAGTHIAQSAVFTRGEKVAIFRELLSDRTFFLSINDQSDTGWRLKSKSSRELIAKLMSSGRPLIEVIQEHLYYGVKTGLNEAFIIDQTTRDRLIKEDPNCTAIINPVLQGEDLRPWYQENEGRWLIFTRRGIDIGAYPAVLTYLQRFREQLEPRPDNWSAKVPWNGRKPGPYKWYEIQDSIEYYAEFEKTKIIFPDIAKKPRFSWSDSGNYIGNTAYCIPTDSYSLLGILSSRTLWYIISQISHPFGERAGATRYRLIRQYMKRLPIPSLSDDLSDHIGNLAHQLTEVARNRYDLRRRTAYRIQQDLGTPLAKLNQRLDLWWELPFREFRQELVRVFKRDIPLKDRDDWEELLRSRSAEIKQLTDEIITLETELNSAVYAAFELDSDEITLIERETKYNYGEW